LLVSTNVSVGSGASSSLNSLLGTPRSDVINQVLEIKVTLYNSSSRGDVDADGFKPVTVESLPRSFANRCYYPLSRIKAALAQNFFGTRSVTFGVCGRDYESTIWS
jgi:hypothetical protein